MTAETSRPGSQLHWFWRLLLSIAGALSAGVITALVVTVMDLYLAGHGRLPLNGMVIGNFDPRLTASDVIMLASMLISGLVVWCALLAATRRR
ncbi:MAG TPA: hypothetical protein H9827_08350 [Candidatus Luteimonas excrementigallinarum]|nr:hypothetical protein [Candidatus Luteimonas excrementigallinarum]